MSSVPYPLDRNINTNRVAKKISKDSEVRSLCGPTISVQILSSFTADYLTDYLVLMFARRGFNASIRSIEYGKIAKSQYNVTGINYDKANIAKNAAEDFVNNRKVLDLIKSFKPEIIISPDYTYLVHS